MAPGQSPWQPVTSSSPTTRRHFACFFPIPFSFGVSDFILSRWIFHIVVDYHFYRVEDDVNISIVPFLAPSVLTTPPIPSVKDAGQLLLIHSSPVCVCVCVCVSQCVSVCLSVSQCVQPPPSPSAMSHSTRDSKLRPRPRSINSNSITINDSNKRQFSGYKCTPTPSHYAN